MRGWRCSTRPSSIVRFTSVAGRYTSRSPRDMKSCIEYWMQIKCSHPMEGMHLCAGIATSILPCRACCLTKAVYAAKL